MKRNKLITKMIECYQQCKIMRYSDQQAFDRVMEILEENGMLPPARFDTMIDAYINKWEPEEK
jgi:hypothetical protein